MSDYKKYLPSKKFTIILSSIIVAVLIIFITKIIIDTRNENKQKKIVATQKEIALREQFLELDSDMDGLKDWEEALWKTDPKVADTDRDGTLDGQEIKDYRDPLKPGPNDKFSEQEIASTKKIVDEYNSLSNTDKFSRTLLSDFIATKKIDGEMTESEVNDFVNSMAEKLPPIETAKVHTLSEIIVASSTRQLDLVSYAENVAKTANEKFLNQIPKDLNAVTLAMSSGKASDLKDLDNSITIYTSVIASLLKIKVPLIYTEDHLRIINSIEKILTNAKTMKNYFNDPILIIPVLNSYGNIMSDLDKSFINIGLLSQDN